MRFVGVFALQLSLLGGTLAGSGPAVAAAQAESRSEWLAVVRHFSLRPEPQWKLTLRRDADDRVLATYTQILPRSGSEVGQRRPGTVDGRVFHLQSPACPALTEIALEFDALRMPVALTSPMAVGSTGTVFELETPTGGPFDLGALPPTAPIVRWAHRAQASVAVCAAADPKRSKL